MCLNSLKAYIIYWLWKGRTGEGPVGVVTNSIVEFKSENITYYSCMHGLSESLPDFV